PAVAGDRLHDTFRECDRPAAIVAADARPADAAHGGDEVTQLGGELIVRASAIEGKRVQVLAERLAFEAGKRYTFRIEPALQQAFEHARRLHQLQASAGEIDLGEALDAPELHAPRRRRMDAAGPQVGDAAVLEAQPRLRHVL